jgi:hypothetical protein
MNKPIDEVLSRFPTILAAATAAGVTRQALSDAIKRDRFSPELARALERATGVSAVRLVFGDDYARKVLRPQKRAA